MRNTANGGEYQPLVSIVIPTRNEAEDIIDTLETCLNIDYAHKEIIVVDDSTDETPRIVASYASRGVSLIHRESNRNGCCGARNLGMQSAKGEIVVLLNADARPRPDFLSRVLVHYQNGADFVVVRSQVLNRNSIWGQYLYAVERTQHYVDPTWSEGFSCRREAAKAAGYIPGDFPVPFCRDTSFNGQLIKAGFKKHIDLTILMEHVVPDRIDSFWRNQVWRGSISSPYAFYFRRIPLVVVPVREGLKALRTVGLDLLVVYPLIRAMRYARCLVDGWRLVPSFFAIRLFQDLALIVGNFSGLTNVVRARKLGIGQRTVPSGRES